MSAWVGEWWPLLVIGAVVVLLIVLLLGLLPKLADELDAIVDDALEPDDDLEQLWRL